MKLMLSVTLLSAAAAAQEGPLMKAILPRYATAKLNLVETAAAMPAPDYEFKLTPVQRSFAGWMEHNVEMNYNLCSTLLGEPAPKDKVKKGEMSKPVLEKALEESFAYCDKGFNSMNDEKALKEMDGASGRKIVPASIMIGLLNSWNEHYGNLVGYMRVKGITPPTTARAQRMQKK